MSERNSDSDDADQSSGDEPESLPDVVQAAIDGEISTDEFRQAVWEHNVDVVNDVREAAETGDLDVNNRDEGEGSSAGTDAGGDSGEYGSESEVEAGESTDAAGAEADPAELGTDYDGLGDAAKAMVSGELDRESFQQAVEAHTENLVDIVTKKAAMDAETDGDDVPSDARGERPESGAAAAAGSDDDGDDNRGDGGSEEGAAADGIDGDLAGQFDSLDEATDAVQNGDIDVGTYADAVKDYTEQKMDQMTGDADQGMSDAGATAADAPMSVDGSEGVGETAVGDAGEAAGDGEAAGAASDALAGQFDSFDAATDAFESGDIEAETYGEAATDYTEDLMAEMEAAADEPLPDSEVGSPDAPADPGEGTVGDGDASGAGENDELAGQFDSMDEVQQAAMDGDIGVETYSEAVQDFNNEVMDRVEAKAEQATDDPVDRGQAIADEEAVEARSEGGGDLAGGFDSLDEATEAMANGDVDAETYGEAVSDYNDQMVAQAMAAAEQTAADAAEPAAGNASERAGDEPGGEDSDDLAGAFDSIGGAADAAARGEIDAETFGDAVEDYTEQVTNEALGDLEAASEASDRPASGDESAEGASDALGAAASEASDGAVDGGDHAAPDGDADSVAGRAAANLSNAPVEEARDDDNAEDTGDGEAGVESLAESREGEDDPEDGREGDLNPEKDATGIHMGLASDDADDDASPERGDGPPVGPAAGEESSGMGDEGDLNPEKDATGIHMGPASDDPEDGDDTGTEASVDAQGEGGAEPEAEGAGEGSNTRTVEAGDTLSSIAEDEYGDPDMWGVIYEANRSQVDGGEAAAESLGETELDAGSVDSAAATDEGAVDAEAGGDAESESDDVDGGDSGAEDLQQAASDAKTETDVETDGIDDPDLIHPGDELEIPSQEDVEQFDPSEYEAPDSFGVGKGPY